MRHSNALDSTVLAHRILERAAQLGLSKKELAHKANISRQTLDNLLLVSSGADRKLPSVQTLMSLSVALRLHPFWLTDALFEEARVAARLTKLMQGARPGFGRHSSCPDGFAWEPVARFQNV